MLRKTYSLIFVILLLGGLMKAQIPQAVTIEKNKDNRSSQMMCVPGSENFAGTVSLGAINAQSNDIDLDTMFLCMNDAVEIIHNGDQILTGDPDPSSAPGICYGYYSCQPTVAGPDALSTIITDPCIVLDPLDPSAFLSVIEGSNLNGDIQLFNDGNFINSFNGGNPLLAFWTPVTFDELVFDPIANIFRPSYESNGPCVSSNVDATIPVVYLSEITVQNITLGNNFDNCNISFDLLGGLPHYDANETYTIDISLTTDSSIKGNVVNGNLTHDEEVEVTVPQPGIYTVSVTDGKSCPLEFNIDMSSCSNPVLIDVADVVGNIGDTICVPITVQNFSVITSFQFAIEYDNTILTVFNELANVHPNINLLPPITNLLPPNAIGYSWFDLSSMGANIPDGETLFEVCFIIEGNTGDVSPVNIINLNTFEIEFSAITTFPDSETISFLLNQGSVTVENPNFNLDVTIVNESCINQNNGGFDITVNNGQAPFTYFWEDVTTSVITGPISITDADGAFSLTNLSPGQYNVTVTDNLNQEITEQILIDQGIDLQVFLEVFPATCNGGLGTMIANAVVNTVIINNPGPEYEFIWSDNSTGNILNGIPAGSYTVTLTDTNLNCTAESTDILPQTAPIQFAVNSITDASCSGIADGALDIDISGGNGSVYNLTFEEPDGTQTLSSGTNITTNGLVDGDYLLIAEDENMCLDTTTVSIGATKSLDLTVTGAPVLNCFGDCDATIEVLASTIGGTSNAYNFTWSPTVNESVAGATTTATDLCAGTYFLTVEDDAGCSTSNEYTVTEPDLLEASIIDVVNESCDPGQDGSITLDVTGGISTVPYTYEWNFTTDPAVGPIATGLSAGNYEVTVSDANFCQVILNQDIIAPVAPIIIEFDDTSLNCEDDTNGTLFVDADPGGSPITLYSWSTGNSGILLDTEINLTAGTYTVTITDAAGCTSVDTAEVTAPDPLLIDNITLNPPLCPGLGGGSIEVTVSGGNAPYFFDWSVGNDGTGQSVNTGANITAGTYSVTIIDALNCPSITETVVLPDPPSIVSNISNIQEVSCFNSAGVPCDGEATVTANYSDNTGGIFSFIWSSGETELNVLSSTAVNLCQGLQTVTISDANCSETFDIDIPAPDPLSSEIDETNVSCFGFSDGSASIQGIGGTSPYSYLWDNNTTNTTNDNLPAGDYTVTITDDNGCISQAIASIQEPNTPLSGQIDSNLSTNSVSCFGEQDAVMSVLASGGNVAQGNIQYLWGAGINADINSSTATGLGAGSYAVTIVDALGCEFPLVFDVTSPDPVTFELEPILPILCPGDLTSITVNTAAGGNGQSELFYTFSVDGGAPQTLGTNIEVFPGDHIITVSDISDAGCSSDTIIVIDGPSPSVLEYPDFIEVELGDSSILSPDVLALTTPLDPDSIFWTPTDFLNFSNGDPLTPTVMPLDDITYFVEAYDLNGCYISAELTVEVDKNRNVYVPNIFTPDGDGINDLFQPFTGFGVEKINYFRIYDRWGEMIHNRLELGPLNEIDPLAAWDGTFLGKDMNQGVYVYLIEVKFLDGRVLLYRGDISLMR